MIIPAELPRVRLAHLPTPIEELKRFSRELGGPRVFIKRDDCTGLAIGGNKTRKLEFIVGDAANQGADTLITEGGLQSNHCRQTVAAAARAGMKCVLVLNRSYAEEVTGNLLLDRILGAEIIEVENAEDRASAMQQAAEELKAKGEKPYIIPTGGSNGIGALGYANFMQELTDQEVELGVRFDTIVTASGSGGTQGGLILGRKLLGSGAQIIGISDGEPEDELTHAVLEVAAEGARVLGASLAFSAEDVTIYDEYFGEGYAIPTGGMVEAVHMLACTEGILLDPVYSGKAMAGLIDRIRRNDFTNDRSVLFIHTGGTPALFAYHETFAG